MTTPQSDVDATDAADSDTVATAVPADATVHECPYCERPFTAPDHVALHVGLQHYDVCTPTEEEAFEKAYLAENEEIRRYRLKAAATLIVLYFGLLMVYAVAA
ncbi:C2H2-type zinc finger protein [Halorubellus sp. PRR65]|uniref:DUF7410 domain-containing protein n=1 Tax=Halorubellus sp. PRR65 TaxID=3098148 RepID=UPI002B25D87C|nr:C2H2-type zinc finger protein [Halorubellus sp. PRR65]